MKYIKFLTTKYEMVTVNVTSTHFQATIKTDSIDEVISELKESESITIYEDEEIVSHYDGYTDFASVCLQPDGLLSVEVDKTDIIKMINKLTKTVEALKTELDSLKGSEPENE